MLIRLLIVFTIGISLFAEVKEKRAIFQAVGNEPGWVLEIISDKKMLFLTNGGESKTHFEITEKFYEYG